jgi:hypothetical protein
VAVRWYLRYGLSYRDVEELLAERVYRAKTRCRSLTRCFTGRARLLAGIR